MDRFASYDTLLAYCQKNNVPHRFDEASRMIELPNTAKPLLPTTVIKFDKQLPLITFVQFMAENIPVERIPELEAAVSRLNTVMEVGGFCIDYERNRLLARFTMTIFPQEGISAEGFQRTFEIVVGNARGFLPVLMKVVNGAPGKDVIQIAREHFAALNAAAAPDVS